MQFQPRIEIIPGLVIVPESRTYPIKPTSVSGHICYFDADMKLVEHSFHLVNSLCKPEEMHIFNISTLNLLVLKRLADARLDGTVGPFNIKWKQETGLTAYWEG